MQNEAEAYLWEHCPRTVHRFVAFAQRLDDRQGVNAALKWRDIAVSALHVLNPQAFCCVRDLASCSAKDLTLHMLQHAM